MLLATSAATVRQTWNTYANKQSMVMYPTSKVRKRKTDAATRTTYKLTSDVLGDPDAITTVSNATSIVTQLNNGQLAPLVRTRSFWKT